MAILTQVRDPRVKDVTVTRVEMAPDMRNATVHVSVMGSAAQQQLALRGLARSADSCSPRSPSGSRHGIRPACGSNSTRA